MPNWCDTTYRVVGEKKQVKKFYDIALDAWKNEENSGWLGHIVTALGGDWKEICCRGWMQDAPVLDDSFDDDYAECKVYCDTAWGEPYDFREFVEEKIDGIFIYYLAIEPGCCVYCSNDNKYNGVVYLDSDESDIDVDLYSEEDAIKILQKKFGKTYDNIDDWIDFSDTYNEESDNFLGIHRIEVEY